MRREDQTSCAPQSGVRGGQLMTGYAVFPDITGPSPLLLPATATNTVGTPSPGERADVTSPCPHVVPSPSSPNVPTRTFIFGFDTQRLVGTLVCRGDPQDAADPVGGAGLPDLLTVSQVRGGAHQNHHPAAGPRLQQQLETRC